MITAGSIKVYSRLSIGSLLDMEMETKDGCHSRLALRGLLSEGKNGAAAEYHHGQGDGQGRQGGGPLPRHNTGGAYIP